MIGELKSKIQAKSVVEPVVEVRHGGRIDCQLACQSVASRHAAESISISVDFA